MSTSFESRPDDGSVISLNDNERGPIDVNLRTHEDDFTYANEMYKAHREYVVHEDDLVNQRTTWAITIESFVIAIFGLTYQKKMEGLLTFHGLDDKKTTSAAIKMNQFVELFDQRLNMIAVFGFAVAVISGIAVYAAQRSIFGVNTAWKKECLKRKFCSDFPQLTGGGHSIATSLGHALPLLLPAFFVGFWLFAIIYIAVFQQVLVVNDVPPTPV